jgi:phosphate transport system substrate-binding protein
MIESADCQHEPVTDYGGEGVRPQQYLRWRIFWLMGMVISASLLSGLPGSAQDATPQANAPYLPRVDLNQLSERIIADGSSTVWPITAEAADRFMAMAPVPIDVEFSGTGGGFRRFCAGDSDIQNASRPITDEERAACEANGVRYEAFTVAFDGITVVVNPANNWTQCLTVEQLRTIWEPDHPEYSWKQVDPAWPDAKIELYGPGPDSGTFDYFTEAIMGETGVTRTDYQPSENDLDLVEGVASQTNALGYFGFAYYEHDVDRLRAVAIDNGNGCVLPSPETIADGSYAPLSRPLFVYVNLDSLARPEVREFLRFILSETEDLVRTVAYVPLPAADYAANRDRLEAILAATSAP